MDAINTSAEILFGDSFFKRECLPEAGYDYRIHKKEFSPYFASHGFKVSMMYNDYYSRLSGYASDRYVSMDLYYFYIVPCLNRREFARSYADKSMYDVLFRGVNQPLSIAKNRNGIYYDSEEKIIDLAQATELCHEAARNGSSMIIKPTNETGEGRGVALLNGESEKSVAQQFENMGKDFIVQIKVEQHKDMAELNASSLNTLRMITYRSLDGRVHHLRNKAILRVGNPGSVRDNVGAGGGMCQVFDSGHVNDRVVHYKSIEVGSFSAIHGVHSFHVPSYEKAILFVEELHGRLPYFDLVAWDVAIDKSGCPLLVEYNLPGEVGVTQQGSGPMFEEDLDEIMERVSRVKKVDASYQINSFGNRFDYLLQTRGVPYEIR